MSRDRNLLALGVFLLAMLPVLRDAHAGQWTPIRDEVTFQCDNAAVPAGSSVYVVGNHPNLGNWDPTKAIKLNNAGSTWTAKVLFPGADDGKDVEWKCMVRDDADPTKTPTLQGGANNVVKLAFTAKSVGTF
ncbi:carbohydrate-binding protein [Pseudomonas sp. TH03]|uniref:carbohydrate-binding module family 20 domain-containing protein n=1 Tax=Pseudomonas sp. TH03 TaxID=2796369 RepID=UPI001913071F|nr:carbohydrate-binding module family 20 domain-containing protein [Pseudomonas sp. TH03]MBK5554117.1 carbohydrate-binding protein [Pseudomonas sp. TH03]